MSVIKSAYKCCVNAYTQHAQMLSQISKEGNYWKVLDDAAKAGVLSKSFQCLQEVLLDSTIKEAISKMFNAEKDSKTWTHEIKTYAFGNYDM